MYPIIPIITYNHYYPRIYGSCPSLLPSPEVELSHALFKQYTPRGGPGKADCMVSGFQGRGLGFKGWGLAFGFGDLDSGLVEEFCVLVFQMSGFRAVGVKVADWLVVSREWRNMDPYSCFYISHFTSCIICIPISAFSPYQPPKP